MRETSVTLAPVLDLHASSLSMENDTAVDPPRPDTSNPLPCPRCQSLNTKFCYYNNYNVKQPRHFCRECQRYWTVGGSLRNVPVGAGRRKHKSSKSASASASSMAAASDDATSAQQIAYVSSLSESDLDQGSYISCSPGLLSFKKPVVSCKRRSDMDTSADMADQDALKAKACQRLGVERVLRPNLAEKASAGAPPLSNCNSVQEMQSLNHIAKRNCTSPNQAAECDESACCSSVSPTLASNSPAVTVPEQNSSCQLPQMPPSMPKAMNFGSPSAFLGPFMWPWLMPFLMNGAGAGGLPPQGMPQVNPANCMLNGMPHLNPPNIMMQGNLANGMLHLNQPNGMLQVNSPNGMSHLNPPNGMPSVNPHNGMSHLNMPNSMPPVNTPNGMPQINPPFVKPPLTPGGVPQMDPSFMAALAAVTQNGIQQVGGMPQIDPSFAAAIAASFLQWPNMWSPYSWGAAPWNMAWNNMANSAATNAPNSENSNAVNGTQSQPSQFPTQSEQGPLCIPKTLRIDHPDEAAQSSILSTLGVHPGSGGFFSAFQQKADVFQPKQTLQQLSKEPPESHQHQPSHVNPAAQARSAAFQEGS